MNEEIFFLPFFEGLSQSSLLILEQYYFYGSNLLLRKMKGFKPWRFSFPKLFTSTSSSRHFVDHPTKVVAHAHARPITATELRMEESSWAVKVNIGTSHSFISDLPHKNLGGQVDLGCSPKELLMSAVAASTAMSVRSAYVHNLYQEGRMLEGLAGKHDDQLPSHDTNWRHSRLDNVAVTVQEELKSDMYVPEEIKLGIILRGQLTAEQEKILLEAADACPVRRMLTGCQAVKVTTSS